MWGLKSPKLSGVTSASQNGALMDLDKAIPGIFAGAFTFSADFNAAPTSPVHGNSRNYGFFDGHISTLKLTSHKDGMTTNVLASGWFSATQ